jgi:hypothetical protein
MKIGTSAMRTLVIGAGAAAMIGAVLGLSACHPPHIRHDGDQAIGGKPMSVAATLTCPASVGALTRSAQGADGQSCDYAGPGGEQVSLKRLALAGQRPEAALAPIEASLRSLVPPRAGPATSADADADDDHDGDSDSGDQDNSQTKVDLPGVHIDAQGDKARVKVLGITVNADGDNADVNVGHGASRTTVQAGPNGAEIHVEDVNGANANLMLILAGEKPGPSGLRAVGYLARGPAAGPLAVATFKAAGGHQDWRSDHDLNALLDLNVKQ